MALTAAHDDDDAVDAAALGAAASVGAAVGGLISHTRVLSSSPLASSTAEDVEASSSSRALAKHVEVDAFHAHAADIWHSPLALIAAHAVADGAALGAADGLSAAALGARLGCGPFGLTCAAVGLTTGIERRASDVGAAVGACVAPPSSAPVATLDAFTPASSLRPKTSMSLVSSSDASESTSRTNPFHAATSPGNVTSRERMRARATGGQWLMLLMLLFGPRADGKRQ